MPQTFRFRTITWVLAGSLLVTPSAVSWAQAPRTAPALPSLGDSGEMLLSEERRLGDRIARSIYRDPDYLDDPALSDYLQSIWRPLIETALKQGEITPELSERFAWQLMLARDRSVNAFALPGGYLGVHLGLIASVASADELASVLAHELSHVSQRHIARLITRQDQQAPWVLAAMVLGALAASAAKNADIANAAIVGGQALAAQSQLNFSRDMEREADRIGYGMMTSAGFDGLGFVSMFDKLDKASRLNDDGAFPYLRSHPLTTERMADMHMRVPNAGAADKPPVISPVWHAMMASRARVLAESQVGRLQSLATQSPPPKVRLDATALGTRYATALAAARLRDAALALPAARDLLDTPGLDTAAHSAARALAIECLLGTQSTQLPGGPTLADLRDQALAGNRRTDLFAGAQAALVTRDPKDTAIERLQTWVTLHRRDALAWQTLAALYAARHQNVRAARAEAEARLAQLDTAGALERLKSAQNLARREAVTDHYDLSILDARTREVERMVREELREQPQARQP